MYTIYYQFWETIEERRLGCVPLFIPKWILGYSSIDKSDNVTDNWCHTHDDEVTI